MSWTTLLCSLSSPYAKHSKHGCIRDDSWWTVLVGCCDAPLAFTGTFYLAHSLSNLELHCSICRFPFANCKDGNDMCLSKAGSSYAHSNCFLRKTDLGVSFF